MVGSEEVEKLHKKLKSLRVSALDDYHISYSDMFSKSLCDNTENFLEIIRDIGSWPQVQNIKYVQRCVQYLCYITGSFRVCANLNDDAVQH